MFDTAAEILLVEDNPNDVELTLHAFKKNKLSNHIHIARDGKEALDYFEQENDGGRYNRYPKIILLDLKLPKIDGLEVLRRLKTNPDTRMIPVVVLTSSREERDILESYQLGVNSYIVKPVDFEKFIETIRTLGMYWLILNQPPLC